MSSHGDSHNLIKLAASFNDYEIIVRHYLEEDQVLSGNWIIFYSDLK